MLMLTGEWADPEHADTEAGRYLLARTHWDGDCLRWSGHLKPGRIVTAQLDGRPGVSVRRWMWECHYGGPIDGATVRAGSSCGDPLCFRRSHQVLRSASEAQAGRVQSPLSSARRLSGAAGHGGAARKIPLGAEIEINRAFWADGQSRDALAAHYGVSREAIRQITVQAARPPLVPGASVFSWAAVLHRRPDAVPVPAAR